MPDPSSDSTIDPEFLDFLELTATPDAPSPSLSLDSLTAPPAPLSNPPPSLTWPTPDPLEASRPLTSAPTLNPVLQRLPPAQRPPSQLACADCPASVWVSGGPSVLQAYCLVMRVTAWTRDEPMEISDCSGREQALLAREMQPGA